MSDLRAAILARLDQLEATARAAMEPRQHAGVASKGVWTVSHDTTVWDDDAMVTVAGTHDGPFLDDEHAQHIATWHPQSVLTLTAGARQLVDSHHPEPFIRTRLVDQPDGTIRSQQTTEYQCSCVDRTDVLYPCEDLKTTARMLGIDPDGDDA